MSLTPDEEELFNKYAFRYEIDDKNSTHQKIFNQKYAYEKIKEKGIENTAILKLINMTQKEIEMQYVRKSQYEIKFGFLEFLTGK